MSLDISNFLNLHSFSITPNLGSLVKNQKRCKLQIKKKQLVARCRHAEN